MKKKQKGDPQIFSKGSPFPTTTFFNTDTKDGPEITTGLNTWQAPI